MRRWAAFAQLREQDGRGAVVGAQGLTLRPTRHRLVLDGVELHTWCAVDAIGVPAALGIDADVTSRCGWCDRDVAVYLDAGVPTGPDDALLWLPESTGTNVRRDSCPLANLFCDGGHLDVWRRRARDAIGKAVTFEEAAALGGRWWARRAGGCYDDAPAGWR